MECPLYIVSVHEVYAAGQQPFEVIDMGTARLLT